MAMETRKDSEARYRLKFKLTRRLFERGYSRDDIIYLYKMIDWILVLPEELELEYQSKIHELEEKRNVSYITSIERVGHEKGLQQGIEQGIEQGLRKGTYNKALEVARRLLEEGIFSSQKVQQITGLSQQDMMELIDD